MNSRKTPPQVPPRFLAVPEVLLQRARQAIAASKEVSDNIVKNVKLEEASFENVLLPLMHANNIYINASTLPRFPKDISTDERLRAASREADKLMTQYELESSMREDLAGLVQAVVDRKEPLQGERLRCLQKIHRGYVHSGFLIKDESQRARFRELKERISDISAECRKNFSDKSGGSWFTLAELEGLPQDHLDRLQKGKDQHEGQLFLTMKTTDTEPVRKFVKDPEIRKKVFLATENKCNINAPLVRELFVLTDEVARLLGYGNVAAMKMQDSIAKSVDFVQSFLGKLQQKLSPAAKEQLDQFRAMKAKDREAQGLPADPGLYLWDTAYYGRIQRTERFKIDEIAVSQYFPLPWTLQAMLKVFEQVFGLSFQDITPEIDEDIKDGMIGKLHPDTKVYQVWNDPSSSNGFLGYLYMDLHQRDFKFNHNAHIAIEYGYTRSDGSRHYPSSLLTCNFARSSDAFPCLLLHRDCVTLFHELGHAIHNLVSMTEFVMVHGTKTVKDFVEAPSMMLENWLWTPEILRLVSCHWSHLSEQSATLWRDKNSQDGNDPPELPSKTMSEELINGLLKSRVPSAAREQLFQIFCALYDLAVHTPVSHEEIEQTDIQKLYNSMRHEITLVDPSDNSFTWGNNQARFAHMWEGYAAGYYGYILASAISADMFESAFAQHPLDSEQGARYRKTILEPGGSLPEMDLLEKFLGRRPDTESWIKQMGF